jgi:trimeric autotransporter adhesin
MKFVSAGILILIAFSFSISPSLFSGTRGGVHPFHSFSSVASADSSWDTRFYYPGCDYLVYSYASSPDGSIFAGGAFWMSGDVISSDIARWDGSQWHDLAGGMNQTVRSLAVGLRSGGSWDLIAGGVFTTAGALSASHIARWDGAEWHSLGAGTNGIVYAVATIPTASGGYDCYAAGAFTTAGSQLVNHIARWDGSAWHDLAGGTDGQVNALAVMNDSAGNPTLYAAGSFSIAGGHTTGGIARWDGNTWTAVGTGIKGTINALACSGGKLYCGGVFTGPGNIVNIARFNGSSWEPLQDGIDGEVDVLAQHGSGIIAGGKFTTAGAIGARNIARWDGASWSSFSSEPDNTVYALLGRGGDLFAGGDFTVCGTLNTGFAARWDGVGWNLMGPGCGADGSVESIAPGRDASGAIQFYAGGNFWSASCAIANYVAAYDGNKWIPLGGGMNQGVKAVASVRDSLGNVLVYAGGSFTVAGAASTKHVAMWDGVQWSALSGGISGAVNTLASCCSPSGSVNLYAGGSFTSAGYHAASNIARWDGSDWSSLGDGLNGTVQVIALSPDGSTLYAGGSFTTAGGQPANHIAMWDGVSWHPLGDGVSGTVQDITIASGPQGIAGVYAAGLFASAGGQSVKNIARWDGSAWQVLGSGLNSYVYALASGVDQGGRPVVYAGGNFQKSGSTNLGYCAMWDGNEWLPLGSGVNNAVHSLSFCHGNLVVGGNFSLAGGKASIHIARWKTGNLLSIIPQHQTVPVSTRLGGNYPNPFNPSTTIHFTIAHTSAVSLKIYDILGRETATVVGRILPPGSYSERWDAAGRASGVYFYRLTADGTSETGRMILAH